MLKEKNWASFQIVEFFTQKFVSKLLNVWVWDPCPGVKKALDPGSGSSTLILCFFPLCRKMKKILMSEMAETESTLGQDLEDDVSSIQVSS
jgi:hypothetical protein